MTNDRMDISELDIFNELETGIAPDPISRRLGKSSRVILETKSLAVLPTVSPFFVGHVLLFAKLPSFSFADLALKSGGLSAEISYITAQYEDRFGDVLIFEHGSTEKSSACGVSRAHLHLIPAKAINYSQLIQDVESVLGPSVRANDWVFTPAYLGKAYLGIRELDGPAAVWSSGVPSQIIRRMIAKQLGIGCWDWKELYGWNIMNQTISSWSKSYSANYDAPTKHHLLQR